jgi:predicted nucleic acid-binding protein
MTRFVIDAATLLRLVRDGRAVDPAHSLVAPNSIRSEALDLLLREVRAGELPESDALQLHERVTEVKIRLLGDRVSRRTAWRIAREHDWSTVRLAEYLAVAKLQADALITGDVELAAQAREIVPMARLEDVFAPG